MHMFPKPDILVEFSVSDPVFVEETAIAIVWKVRSADGSFAALKIYKKPDMGNERKGFAFLSALNGRGAAKVLSIKDEYALTEWLDGPSLGDIARGGDDVGPNRLLVAVANQIHADIIHVDSKLPNLTDWFGALFTLQFAETCPQSARENILSAQVLARKALAEQRDIRPLHGDLHHDNIRASARGHCAFDAKGVLGERAYELANAFRNPKGADKTIRDPARINQLLDLWSHGFCVERRRLLIWATAKCALSIAWRSGPVLAQDPEFDLLATFLRLLDAHPT